MLSTSKTVLSTVCEFSANTPWQENWKLKKKTVILWYSTRHCILRGEIRNVRSSKTLYIGIFSVKSGEESAGLKCNILFVNIIKTLPIYSTQQCQLFLPKRLAVSYDDKPRRFFYSLQKNQASLILFRSLMRIFMINQEDTTARCKKNQASLILFRSLMRIFASDD